MKTEMRHIIAMIILAAVLAPAQDTYAQGGGDPLRAQAEIERTDEVIANAREIVRDSRSQKARTALEYAIKLQEKARNSSNLSYHKMAIQLTGQARKEAWHAINLARTAARMEERTKRLTEHATETLISLRARIAETGLRDHRTIRLMQESQSMLEKSRVNYRQLRGELALKLAENAFRLAGRAEERFRRTLDRMEMCRRRLELMERLAERARSRLAESGSDRDRMQLEKAEEHIYRARGAISAGRYEFCRINIEASEKILRNLTRNTSRARSGDPREVVAEARRLQHRAEDMIGSPEEASDQALMLLERAGRMLDRAESELAGGNGDEALRLSEEARRTLRRAVERSRGDLGRDEAAAEVEKAAELGEMARAVLEECDTEGAEELFERAAERIRKARENLDSGLYERAAAESRIARNLYYRVREICSR